MRLAGVDAKPGTPARNGSDAATGTAKLKPGSTEDARRTGSLAAPAIERGGGPLGSILDGIGYSPRPRQTCMKA